MLFIKSVLLFFFAVGAFASSLQHPKRDVVAIQTCLKTLDSDVQDLTTKIKAWDGSTSGAIPIQQAANKLNQDCKSCVTTVQNSGTVTAAEAQTIRNYVNNTLIPDIKAAIAAIQAKKSQFTAAGLGSFRDNTIKAICDCAKNLISAVCSKLGSSSAVASCTNDSNNRLPAECQGGTLPPNPTARSIKPVH